MPIFILRNHQNTAVPDQSVCDVALSSHLNCTKCKNMQRHFTLPSLPDPGGSMANLMMPLNPSHLISSALATHNSGIFQSIIFPRFHIIPAAFRPTLVFQSFHTVRLADGWRRTLVSAVRRNPVPSGRFAQIRCELVPAALAYANRRTVRGTASQHANSCV